MEQILRSLTICYSLLAIRYSLSAIRYLLFAICYWLFAICLFSLNQHRFIHFEVFQDFACSFHNGLERVVGHVNG